MAKPAWFQSLSCSMANFTTRNPIKRLRSRWRFSETRFMKRSAPGFLGDCLPLSTRFIVAMSGSRTENGSLPARLRQKRNLQSRWRLAMTTRISRQYCGALDQELDQNRRSPPLPFLRQPTRQQWPQPHPRLQRLPLPQNRMARTTTTIKTGLCSDVENSLLQAQRKSLTTPQPCLLQLAWERQICQLQTLANKRLVEKSQACR